jgi:hypothetical protein
MTYVFAQPHAPRRSVVGLIASAGALLAFGMTPLAMTPSAHADEFDVIIDPIINAISSIDPTLGTDLTGALGDFTTSSGWDSVLADFSSLDSSFGASSSVVSETSPASEQALTASGSTEAASTESMFIDLQKLHAAITLEEQKIDALLISDLQSAEKDLSLSEMFIASQDAAIAEQLREIELSIVSAANTGILLIERNII